MCCVELELFLLWACMLDTAFSLLVLALHLWAWQALDEDRASRLCYLFAREVWVCTGFALQFCVDSAGLCIMEDVRLTKRR